MAAKILEGFDRRSEFDETMRNISGILQNKFPDIKIDIPGLDPGLHSTGANFLLFMCSLVFGMFWITFITFFNSRVVGKILTRIANRFVPEGYVKIGSLSWSVLPGKVMFRDVAYVTKDYTLRVQDGFVIFRWWLAYVPKDVSEDLSHSDTRVSVQLNGLELHVYNRTAVYRDLEKKFGFESRFFPPEAEEEPANKNTDDPSGGGGSSNSSYILGKNWRDLIPVIKIDLASAKFVFGNKLLPTTLVVSLEEAHCTYSTKPAACALDHFMHFVKCRVENLKVLLAPSPKYTGMTDEAPRYMGEGFVVVSSSELNLYYYMDEAGLVPAGETSEEYPLPDWGVDVRCGKGTDLSYGPWADRQRELIYKFFFPQDYQPLTVTAKPDVGQKRQARAFLFRLSTEHESTMDVLFSKLKETNAVHVNIGQGTNFEMKIPWVVAEEGYTSTINGTAMMIEATTSLAYREFLQMETLQFKIDMNYPINWNAAQEWVFTFVGTKTSLSFIYAHKWFFQDLLEDWSAKSPPDLLYFVPYTWKFRLSLKQFELLTLTNEFNWVDTSSTNQENSHMGLCGEALCLNFDLPYTEFLPRHVPFNFDIMGENIDLVLFLPETNTSHDILYSLDLNAKIVTPEGKWRRKLDGNEAKWRRICKYGEGWIDCWAAPSVALQIEFLYHPVPLPGPRPQADMSSLEKEKQLLTPLRAPSVLKKTTPQVSQPPPNFDPDSLEADKCSVKVYIGNSTAYLYGTLIRSFMHLKENIFGEDQQFTPMDSDYSPAAPKVSSDEIPMTNSVAAKVWDPRQYRPIEVVLDITINNLQAHLIKNCSLVDDPCPFLSVEQIGFEMNKRYRETRLQLVLSPVVLRSGSLTSKSGDNCDLRQGHLLLTGLQFRGQGMFSELDRPLGCDTLEYAWLIEIQCGSLVGKITAAQLYNVLVCLETFMHLIKDDENVLKHPRPFKICQHGNNQKECLQQQRVGAAAARGDYLCDTVEEMKYRLVRFLVDSVDVHVVENASALRIQACPIRFSTCNLHGLQTKQGITALVKQVQLQQYISSNFPLSRADVEPTHHQDIWVESGSVRFGPVFIEGGMSGHSNSQREMQKIQHDFLQKHDNKVRRLWFLWPQGLTKITSDRVGKCGCVGGCNFFGSNINGLDFFDPDRSDIVARKGIALPSIRDRWEDPGYGQSILHDNQLVTQGYYAFGIGLENILPQNWPFSCQEPVELPFCPDYQTHKSGSSHNSSDTPKHPKYHRSFSTKQGTPLATGRNRSISITSEGIKLPSAENRSSHGKLSSEPLHASPQPPLAGSALQKTSSLAEVTSSSANSDSRYQLARTESLVSDVLSFYSLDGEDPASKVSFSLSSPKSLSASLSGGGTRKHRSSSTRSPTSTLYETASSGGGRFSCSPTSTQYETASQGMSSPTSGQYETASTGGASSSFSFDTPTLLQAITPTNDNNLDHTGSATISRAGSSGSFLSAVSDHEEGEEEEEGLINLHMQVNKPITDSPLLMSSYISHLTQLRCSFWGEGVPVLAHEPHLNGQIKPQFDMLEEGFSVIQMRDRKTRDSESGQKPAPEFRETDCGGEFFSAAAQQPEGEEFVSNDSRSAKTTVVVKFHGSIDVICCPIMLQSLEKSLQSLASLFRSQHPIDVVNHLHTQSVDRVESKNTLKKEKAMDLQEKLVVEPRDPKGGKSGGKDKDYVAPSDMFRTFEKSISSYVQASLSLPKINIMVLQASVVEEVCAFSALDRVKDITCVSLLALGIQETTFQFCKTSQSKKTVQIYMPNQRHVSGKKKKTKYKMAPDLRQNEPFTFESSETQREEVLMTGSMKKVHAQLRRLRNDSSILQEAAITAIPNHKSKVFFDYVNVPRLSNVRASTPVENVSQKKEGGEKLGYNMCECGFEGISLKLAKRSCNKDNATIPDADANETVHIEDEILKSPAKESKAEEDIAAASTATGDNAFESGYVEEDSAAAAPQYQGKRSTASGSAEMKTAWFNFAAPPKTPISKKIDFTKLDWNLLSTASPSFDAWLGPIDRLQEALANCTNTYHSRVGATMASLMADALDVAPENFLKLTKYDKLTALSKTLRDDPSCQLCSILLKYMIRGNLADIEANLDIKGVPPLTTLRQGIVVLSRQWKNALYTPILIEYNLRCRSLKNIYGTQMNLEPVREEIYGESDEEEEEEEEEEEDDNTRYDEGSRLLQLKSSATVPRYALKSGSIVSDFSASLRARLSPANFSPLSDEVLLLEKSGQQRFVNNRASIGSAESNEFLHSVPSELIMSGGGDGSPTPKEQDESLYEWMKRQQQQTDKLQERADVENVTITVQEEETLKHELSKATTAETPQTKSMHLLDAHIIFEPLLSSLGLMPQQIQNLSLKNLGYNVSVLGSIDEFKIDIIESEFGKRQQQQQQHNLSRGLKNGSFRQVPDFDPSPAFLCEKVYLQIDFKKVTDIAMIDTTKDKVAPLYMSRAQLKRHTSTLVNFSIDIQFISQKVNMPLLRLVNQIVTMHQNVRETNEELREKKPEELGRKDYMRHKKSSSGSSTSSNISAQIGGGGGGGVRSTTAEPPAVLPGQTPQSVAHRSQPTQSPASTATVKTPTTQLRNRPKSFAQKFRPNSRLAGYSNLESPMQEHHDSFILTSAPLEMITEEQTLIRCWKTMYNLLELYSTMPVTKTVHRQSLTPMTSSSSLEPGAYRSARTAAAGGAAKTPEHELPSKIQTPSGEPRRAKEVSFAKADVVRHEHTPIIVFGVVRISKTKLMATLSGLKLNGEILGLQTSMQYREKIRTPMKGVVEASVIGHMQATNLVLLEGQEPNQQTVVKVTIGKTQVIHTSQMWKTKDKNSGTLTVDLVQVEIPQHPVDLHGIVTRGTKELSSTLQEFIGKRILQKGRTPVVDDAGAAGYNSAHQSPKVAKREPCSSADESETPAAASVSATDGGEEKSSLIKPFVMQFHIHMHKLCMSAALLPSLNAEYSMQNLSSRGMTGSKAKFVVDLPKHSLSFNTKLQDLDQSEANLPSEAFIALPKVQVSAEYIHDDGKGSDAAADGSIISQGSYLKAEAEIGELEHWLTTDLLNHLVFVQKVFMREVNDVVQKMSGSDRPVPVWTEFGELELYSANETKRLLFSVAVRLKNITITATTPANSGVRFETGNSELHISNRVQNIQGSSTERYKIFTKAKVNIKLSLGQLIRDPIYYEAEPQFQQQAYFKTTIHLRNAFQGEIRESGAEVESDVIYITLNRPLVFVQPVAVDRAILFWLSYKNAWEYWTEQRLNLHKDILLATEQVLEKVPLSQITSQLSAQHIGTIFLQLNVQDIGLCVPFSLDPRHATKQESDNHGAIVATVESSSISACSAHSTVSKGKFQELCVRFADDFNHDLDDWKPDMSDPNLMNLCFVSEGSYEICSQTTKAIKEENAKWLLNIQWQMTGVDVHVDTNIGKHLSALTNTLTTLTGKEEEEDEGVTDTNSVSEEDDLELSSSDDLNMWKKTKNQIDLDLPPFLFDPNLPKSVVAKYLEHEINEQAKTVEDLQKLGASEHTVAAEMKKLNELQNIASKNFRQDLVEKLRRQKSKANYFKEKFGLGPGGSTSNNAHHRLGPKTKSMFMASPTTEDPEFSKDRRKISQPMAFNRSLDGESEEDSSRFPIRASTIAEEDDGVIDIDQRHSRGSKTSSLSPKSGSLPLNATAPSTKALEQNVDFEFHIKIFVNSGKCVLHTLKEEEKRRMRKDRSFSGNLTDSPIPIRKVRNDFKPVHSSTRIRDMRQAPVQQDSTIFFIPGLDVRVIYHSVVWKPDARAPDGSSKDISGMKKNYGGSKKATLTAWMTLQSIPEETIITPTILEFLEQALAPIPTFNLTRGANCDHDDDDDDFSNDPDSNSGGSQTGFQMPLAAYTSFPVDVIVYFHMQSSTFRFSCLPISRVECMLRLPSLDLVFSSKRAEGEINEEFSDIASNSSSRQHDEEKEDVCAIGGLSITGCLNDFSLFMFHPYGGGRKTRPEDMNFSPLTSEERKDSLSVNVAFVKFHISRSRKLNFNKISLESSQRLFSSSKLLGGGGGGGDDKKSMACVRFSTIVDIGSASFKYDMRRLTEILAFPKAWYRRTLVRRLFLGELRTTSFHTEAPKGPPVNQEQQHDPPPPPTTQKATGRRQSVSHPLRDKRASISMTEQQARKIWIGQTTAHSWETLVVTTLKFKELTVHMNMGNVMGMVNWTSSDFKSAARLSIASTGHKNLFLSLGLTGSFFEAKSGIIGGAVTLGRIDTFCQLKEDSGIEPFHKLGIQLDAIEIRFDYMSTSVLMGRISDLKASMHDDWHVRDVQDSNTMQPAQIFVQGDLSWDQLQVLISKSTTADLIKISGKLEEFFSQQFKSSKKLFSSLEPGPWSGNKKKLSKDQHDNNASASNDGSYSSYHRYHHRHWQKSLRKISGMKIYTLPFKLPEVGSVLGGVLELRGKHISLACFHGINFKCKSWALFSLKDPSISFVSDAQEVVSEVANAEGTKESQKNTTIIQTLSFSLGQSEQPKRTNHSYMATVKKISRNVSYLPPIKTLPEWFNYAFRSSELDEVSRFPSLSSTATSVDPRSEQVQQKTEEIFALPCLTMDLKTRHEQGNVLPRKEDPKPVVDCTFVTDFDNHIYVTTDAEAFFFLHDLISSYVKEKERVLSIQLQQQTSSAEKMKQQSKDKAAQPLDPLQNDWRQFECNTWHLEPTVRLISWAGSEIEPYGVDYILQRLGFSHARTTIPKWLQRGCMDPLDKVLSVIVLKSIQLVQVVQEEKKNEDPLEKRRRQ